MVDFPNSLRDFDDSKPKPDGISLTSVQTGVDGVRAVIAYGECFGDRIDWSDERSEVTVTVKVDPVSGLPGLSYPFPSGHIATHDGLDPDGVTWWRYAHEVDPHEYREHCLRVVALI